VFEVRIHGRGGQGVVTAAELLSAAAFEEGRHAQAFPSFGSERTGAPVVAFCRVSEHPIRVREPVMRPHALVIQDATLLHQVDVFAGLRDDGYVLVNSARDVHALGLEDLLPGREGRVLTVPATDLARAHIGRPMPNAVLLGALAALTGLVRLGSVTGAVADRFPPEVAEANIAAAAAAYDLVTGSTTGTTSTTTTGEGDRATADRG
jgi:pyruvate ferredoxin oxidoreductase gamma subunit